MPKTARRIVVPVDFSAHAQAACERAFVFAAASGSKVEILHAYPPPASVLDVETPPHLLEQLRENEELAFARFCAIYDEQGREFERTFVERDPAEAIHSAARESDAGLIVMGSHGRRGMDRLLLGSVAERTLHGAPVPVLIVREDPEEATRSVRSILLATDFSEDAERAERWTACWSKRLGAEVEVIHAIRETSVLFAPYAVAGSSDFEGEMLEAATQRMERVILRLEAQGISAKPKIVYGRPAESIVERAEATGAQMIVTGSRGYSTLRRFLVGSVAQRVVRHAPCSVLVAGSATPDANR